MKRNILLFIIIASLFISCQKKKNTLKKPKDIIKWNKESLKQRALKNLDSLKRDHKLLEQDIENYNQFADYFKSLPLNKSPFPVAEYDFAVSIFPFVINKNGNIIKGYKIGEFKNEESDVVLEKLTLMVLTNDINSEEAYLAESRNAPYLTAEGFLKVSNNKLDWVFSSSPDGFSILLLNMKLFDLRFGETIIIYPQKDGSFLYDQIEDSPNNYKIFEEYKNSIINSESVKKQLSSKNNI